MSVIDRIMSHDSAKWINEKIADLPNRSKYRASNSIRALEWANRINHIDLPIPACYCALHATEEAVAAFVSCAKECGYKDAAKINIKDHRAKATVSLLTQKVSNIISDYSPSIARDQKKDQLIIKFTKNEKFQYSEASAKVFHFIDDEGEPVRDFYKNILESFGKIQVLKEAVREAQEARNKIFYADSQGIPSGFHIPEESLTRECGITLGLLWAAVDIHNHKGELLPFINQALKTANLIIEESK